MREAGKNQYTLSADALTAAEKYYKEALKYGYEAARCYAMLASILKEQGKQQESLDYLHKGGRCSGVARFFGTMARLKPVIAVIDGKLDVIAKPIGKRKGLKVMIDDIVENKDNIHYDKYYIKKGNNKFLITVVFPDAGEFYAGIGIRNNYLLETIKFN